MISERQISTPQGELKEITIKVDSGAYIQVLNLGGILSGIYVPDKQGQLENVCLGFDQPEAYLGAHPCFSTLIGRYANRIAKGQFELNGESYSLPINNGENTLHGGPEGFDKKFWDVTVLDEKSLKLSLTSPDGDMGFPGEVLVEVIYHFSNEGVLKIDYQAKASQSTPINLTQHAYFNLKGGGDGTVEDHVFKFESKAYTPVNDALIPTGEIKKTAGTEFDFSDEVLLKDRFEKGVEYDHNLILENEGAELVLAARVHHPESGRVLEMKTTEPAFQFYTANFLDGQLKNAKGPFLKWGGFCLEAQHFPDSVHHDHFPPCILNPGETYTQTTEYKFSVI